MKDAGHGGGPWGGRDGWRPLSERWEAYEAWNRAIADVMFPELDFPSPVYLDFEDDRIEAIAAAVGNPIAEVEHELARSVVGVLDFTEGPMAVLRTVCERTRRWNRAQDWSVPPPMLGFLSVLSMAAERMASSDDYASTNFYGRLREQLSLSAEDSTKLEQCYRKQATYLWGTLKAWLLRCDGRRGLPTIEASHPRYVGYPITQAMMRAGDRERLIDFFESSGLPPGSNIPPQQLEGLFDSWIQQHPSPASKNLQRMWVGTGSRQRVLDAAAAALSTWNGQTAGATDEHQAGGRLRLSLAMSSFPKKRLGVGVLAYLPDADTPRDAELLTSRRAVEVSLTPSIPGALTLGESSAVSPASLLESDLVIRDGQTGRTLTRHPRRLVIFRQDEMTTRWTETDRALLTEDLRLLCFDQLLPRVRGALDEAARPGWREQDQLPGLPEGWTLITDVQLFDVPRSVRQDSVNDLQGLVPLTTSHLSLTGGFALPGATRGSWHVGEPPEIRAVSDAVGGFTVRLEDVTDGLGFEDDSDLRVIDEWSDDGAGVLVVDLAEAELAVGDYRVSLWPHGSKEAESSIRVRLADGDHPDGRQWDRVDPVVLDPTHGLEVMGVDRLPADREPDVHPVPQELLSHPLSTSPTWSERHSGAISREPIRLAAVSPDSCLYTGAHMVEVAYVPLDSKGWPQVAWTSGTCRGCGLTRRYSTSYKKNRSRHLRGKTAAEQDPHDLSVLPARQGYDDLCWDLALDGLFYTGGGGWSHFDRVARHIQSSGLVVDQFARYVEALGHVNIRRDAVSLRPVAWEVAPSTLVRTGNGYFFSGYWPDGLTNMQVDAAGRGAQLRRIDNAEGPASWFLSGTPDELVDGVVAVEDGWQGLALRLPRISAVVDALPRQSLAATGQLRLFDPRESRWLDADGCEGPGAYRLSRFSTVDFVRTGQDVVAGHVALSTVQLSKHAAPWITGNRPLLSYDPARSELSVPLGAELPGMYARAAVMASGLLPYKRERQMVYRNVPGNLAEHLAYLFSH